MNDTERLNDQTPDDDRQIDAEGSTQDTMATTSLSPIRGSNGYQQQIPIDPTQPLELSISNASGEVKLLASDQQNVWVVVRRVDGKVDEEDEVGITINAEGNRISVHPDWQIMSGLSGLARRVKSQLKDGFNADDWNISKMRLNPNLEYDIRVEVPRELAEKSRVSIKTASGGVEARGVRADLSVATASGSARLDDLHGRVAVHTASGSVDVHAVTGSLEANTASGSIRVEDGEAWTALRSMSGSIKIDRFIMKNARVTTVSGSVQANLIANNRSDYSFETVSGSLKLQTVLPGDGSGASLTFRSLSGSANVNGDWVPASGKRNWQLAAGPEGPAFRVKTVSGSLQATGKTDTDIALRTEPLPTEPEPEWMGPGGDEETGPLQDERAQATAEGRDVKSDLDLDLNWDKAMDWVKEATRRIQQATSQLH
ncbi:MAG TPA: DUF4097 family beta strand repeat-containing protein, partial [Thermomicrobiales bacterium]|nr:DUF4097 family beta strand repeat-containing protein [Thermomicrobiales bacterium]